jgi:hypothetical protein
MIAGQHVGVAMGAGRSLRIVGRIVPGAAGEPDHTPPHRLGHDNAGKAGSSIIEDAHDITVRNAAGVGILRVDRQRLAPGDLAPGAHRPRIHLAVQFVARLARHEV